MAEVVLDANVIVAYLDEGDSQHDRATALVERLEQAGDRLVMLDICIGEAVSVLCRRAKERKTRPPDLRALMATVRSWHDNGELTFVARETQRLFDIVLDVVDGSGGVLNFNDALLVVLEREGVIDKFASFDEGFDAAAGFQRIS